MVEPRSRRGTVSVAERSYGVGPAGPVLIQQLQALLIPQQSQAIITIGRNADQRLPDLPGIGGHRVLDPE